MPIPDAAFTSVVARQQRQSSQWLSPTSSWDAVEFQTIHACPSVPQPHPYSQTLTPTPSSGSMCFLRAP
ncbi:hypothetical protein C8F01DRAFT_1250516 [Mycena amicta]|nr:hypothetical protein C8F01DRAFT_1250516 [Mycena amicta]